MTEITTLLWFLPLLFIFHDFEEIIFIQPWLRKNGAHLSSRFPALSARFLGQTASLTTSAFALGVAEEFLIICAITITAYMTGWYYLWLGTFIAFTIHLVIHIGQAVIFKGYVPSLITSILCLPVCTVIIVNFIASTQASLPYVALFSSIAFILMLLNLALIHKAMARFDRWVIRYQNISE